MRARIIKKISEVKHWPVKKMYKVLWEKNGQQWEADILPEEYKLIMALQKRKSQCLFDSDIDELFKLVDDFGQAKWTEGNDDAEIDNDW